MNIDALKDLTNSSLNELCATKVMGWEKKRNGPFGTYYFKEDGTEVSHIDQWNPSEDMNDTKQILDHFKGMNYDIKINSTISGWCCNIPFVHEGKRFFAIHHDELLTRTISICALLVVGD